MARVQVEELMQILDTTLRSSTIEWAANLQVCDMLSTYPALSPLAVERIKHFLHKESPVPVLLSLGLLEMMVKNCGLPVCCFFEEELVEAMVDLVKKKESWRYGFGRNLHKSGMASWVPSGFAIDEGERKLWQQASTKVLEVLQLCADAFLLQEGRMQPLFAAYKKLRQEGYQFPRSEQGTSTGLCLVHGAEESPAYLAGAAGTSHAAPAPATPPPTTGTSAPTSPAPPAAAAALPAPVVEAAAGGAVPSAAPQPLLELEEPNPAEQRDATSSSQGGASGFAQAAQSLLADMQSYDPSAGRNAYMKLSQRLDECRAQALRLIDADDGVGSDPLNEEQLVEVLSLLEQLNETSIKLPAPSSGGSALPPPPPAEDFPSPEAQEMYDLMLARYLQERENAEGAQNAEDTANDEALARRLAQEEERMAYGGSSSSTAPTNGWPALPTAAQDELVRCVQCNCVNHLPHGGFVDAGTMFSCYVCGFTQGMPRSRRRASLQARASEVVATRHAPPARVICAGGDAPELLIDDGRRKEDIPEKEVEERTGSSTIGAIRKAAAYGGIEGDGLSTGLLGGGGDEGGSGPVIKGSAPSSSMMTSTMKSWVKSAASSAAAAAEAIGAATGGSSSSSTRRLGDGVPSKMYKEMGGSEMGASLMGEGGRKPASTSSMMNWLIKKQVKHEELGESLLDRVAVNDEWELIRPPDGGRPYWYNSETQVSQWEPPEVVRRAGT